MMADFSKKLARVVLAFALLFHGQVFASPVVLPSETRVYIETMEELIAKGDRVTQGQMVASQVWRDVVIDRVNSEEIKPLKLKILSEAEIDDEVFIKAQIKIKTLVKKFDKGINSIEIANTGTPERVSARLMVDIEI